jgi:Icc-related predicted phosphoesterase
MERGMFWKKSGNEKLTRILYGSDFHGSEAVFRKFISAAFQYKANVLIVGGDVTGKAMVPIVHQGNGVYVGHLFGRREELSTQDQLDKFRKTVSNVGFYPIVVEKDEAAALESNQEILNARFEAEMCQRVRQWMILAHEKLLPADIQLFFMPGNDDLQSIDAVIDEFDHVHNPDMHRYDILGGYEVVGNSNANMTPWA